MASLGPFLCFYFRLSKHSPKHWLITPPPMSACLVSISGCCAIQVGSLFVSVPLLSPSAFATFESVSHISPLCALLLSCEAHYVWYLLAFDVAGKAVAGHLSGFSVLSFSCATAAVYITPAYAIFAVVIDSRSCVSIVALCVGVVQGLRRLV